MQEQDRNKKWTKPLSTSETLAVAIACYSGVPKDVILLPQHKRGKPTKEQRREWRRHKFSKRS